MLSSTARISSQLVRPGDGNQSKYILLVGTSHNWPAIILWKEYWNFPLHFFCAAHETWNVHKHYSCKYYDFDVAKLFVHFVTSHTLFLHNFDLLKCILTFYASGYWVGYDNKTPFSLFLSQADICSIDAWWAWKSFSLFSELPSLASPLVCCQHKYCECMTCGIVSDVHNRCTFTVKRVHPLEPGIVIWPHALARRGRVPWSLPAPSWLHPFVPQSWPLFRPGRRSLLSFGQAPSPPSWTAWELQKSVYSYMWRNFSTK